MVDEPVEGLVEAAFDRVWPWPTPADAAYYTAAAAAAAAAHHHHKKHE
jgi:hypothetical protein